MFPHLPANTVAGVKSAINRKKKKTSKDGNIGWHYKQAQETRS